MTRAIRLASRAGYESARCGLPAIMNPWLDGPCRAAWAGGWTIGNLSPVWRVVIAWALL